MTLANWALAITLAVSASACGETLAAGSTQPRGILPVDERNPVILTNDNVDDNWQGVYAMLLANSSGPRLAGIIVNSSRAWTDLEANVHGWRSLIASARASGLDAPDPIPSIGAPLVRPESGRIDDTTPNRSEGARFIVDTSRQLSLPYRPLVVATGGRLTDIADAYLVDPTVADRIVVVSSLGSLSDSGAKMGLPNGEMDAWAGAIVATRLRYVQVSAFYDQLTEVPAARLAELPDNPLGEWIAEKQADILNIREASDQVAIAALGFKDFAITVQKAYATTFVEGSEQGPDLARDPEGPIWVVSEIDGARATSGFWRLLSDKSIYTR